MGVRAIGVEAIKLLGENASSAAPEVAKLFDHDEADVRTSSAEAMGYLGKNAAPHVERMANLLTDDVKKVTEMTEKQLIALKEHSFKAIPALTRLLQHRQDDANQKAHRVLTAIGKCNDIPAQDRQAFESYQQERRAAAKQPAAKAA